MLITALQDLIILIVIARIIRIVLNITVNLQENGFEQ